MPLPKTVARRMAAHLDALATEHGVALSWLPEGRSRWEAESFATVTPPVALVPRIDTGADYLIGLHEIGHCASEDALRTHDTPGSYAHVVCEAGAWAFAAENANPALAKHLRKRDWAKVSIAMGSHIRAATLSQPGDHGPVRH